MRQLFNDGSDELLRLIDSAIPCNTEPGSGSLSEVIAPSGIYVQPYSECKKSYHTLLHMLVTQPMTGMSLTEILTTLGSQAREVLKQGDLQGNTLLHHAVRSHQLGAVKILLQFAGEEASVLIQQWNYQNQTALHFAVAQQSHEMIQLFLSILGRRASTLLQEADNYHNTPLHLAVRNADEVTVSQFLEILIDEIPEVLCGHGGSKSTSVLEEALSYLLQSLESSQADQQKYLAIVTLCFQMMEPEYLKTFFQNRNSLGSAILYIATKSGDLTLIQALLQSKDRVKTMLPKRVLYALVVTAIRFHHIPVLTYYLDFLSLKESRSALRCHDGFKNTPFHLAVLTGDVIALKKLLQVLVCSRVSDYLGFKNAMGETPLHLAIKQNHLGILTMLLQKLNRQSVEVLGTSNYFGDSPLHLAAQEDSAEMMEACLVAAGPAVKKLLNTTNHHRETPFMIASRLATHALLPCLEYLKCFYTKELTRLLQRKDEHGNSILHHALSSKNFDIALILLSEFKPELKNLVKQSNRAGQTPWMIAMRAIKECPENQELHDIKEAFKKALAPAWYQECALMLRYMVECLQKPFEIFKVFFVPKN